MDTNILDKNTNLRTQLLDNICRQSRSINTTLILPEIELEI